MGGGKELARMVECDRHHYPKYMYEDTNWCKYTLYTTRDMKNCCIYVIRIVMHSAVIFLINKRERERERERVLKVLSNCTTFK